MSNYAAIMERPGAGKGVVSYSYTDSSITEIDRTTYLDANDEPLSGQIAFQPGGEYVHCVLERGSVNEWWLFRLPFSDGALGAFEALAAVVTSGAFIFKTGLSFTSDGTRLAFVENSTGVVQILDPDTGAQVTTLDLGNYGPWTCAFNEEGNRLMVIADNNSTGNSTAFLLSFENDTLAQLDSLEPGFDLSDGGWAKGTTRFWAGRNTIGLFESSGDTLSLLGSAANTDNSATENDLCALSGTKAITAFGLFEYEGSTVTRTIDKDANQQQSGAADEDGDLALLVDHSDSDIHVFDASGTEVVTFDSGHFDDAYGIATFAAKSVSGPTTPAEIFAFAYADVSGRDPLPTALNERTAARNLADFYVSQYRYNPRIVRKDIQVVLGELSMIRRGRMIWIQDAREPTFAAGRWAQILGASGGARPGTVTLELRIADNPESFIPPS